MSLSGHKIELLISHDTMCDQRKWKKSVSVGRGLGALRPQARIQSIMSWVKPMLAGIFSVSSSSFPTARRLR